VLLSGFGLACQEPPVWDPDDAMFDPDRLLEIQIQLDDEDFETIRHEGRDLTALAEGCLDGPPERIYTYFPATVTIDGETLKKVGVRKKGYLGSVMVSRPSLKMKFDEFVSDRYFHGMRRMTVNNGRQDPSRIRTCMAYKIFRLAGVPAPRCNFAHVEVNGEDLGVYAHVEDVKKPFLVDHFGDASGNLYEAQLSDFRPDWVRTFENKTHRDSTDRSDLQALVTALESTDDELVSAVEAHVDLEAFMTFWATEALAGTWDGYVHNQNNYFVYPHPQTGKFHFVPWGPDVAFTLDDAFGFEVRPHSVSANGKLPNRLYGLESMRTRYVQRLRALLDEVWSEQALLAEVDTIEALIAPYGSAEHIEAIRGFIRDRRAGIEAELADGPPEWDRQLKEPPCFQVESPLTGSFSTTWGSLDAGNPFESGTGTMEFTLDGEAQTFTRVAAQAGESDETGVAQPSIRVLGLGEDMSIQVLALFIEESLFQTGVTAKFHGFSTVGFIIEIESGAYHIVGFVSGGSVTLQEASRETGESVSGEFEGVVLR
jgi:spore coat protein CotH